MTEELLSSWRDGPTRQAIIDFVGRTCGEDGSAAVPVDERVAVFDNDGTLWCEKPMPIQLDFIIRRLAEMAAAQHPTLGRGYLECGYAPMVELLDYLEEHGFSNYIASGGGRDFMRPISQDMYGIPREQALKQAEADGWTVVSIKNDWATIF